MEDGSVCSCGKNEFGQLGLGDSIKLSKTPSQIMGLPKISEIYCGDNNTFALSVTGDLWAWGLNTYGQLGIGTQENSFYPVMVKAPGDIKLVAPGPEFTYLLTTNGSIYCFGRAIYLGLGYEVNKDKEHYISLPIEHPFFNREKQCSQITCGTYHSLALTTTDGFLWSWGECAYGKLGNYSIVLPPDPHHPILRGFEVNPIIIETSLPGTIVKIISGSNHSMVLLSSF